jgi:hypothetical protein
MAQRTRQSVPMQDPYPYGVPRNFVRISEAARRTGLPPRLIRTGVETGKLPSIQPFGPNSWRFVDMNSLPRFDGE